MKTPGNTRMIEAGPIQVVCGSTLCELRIWDEVEWEMIRPAQRPTQAVHVQGLGWIVAVPVVFLN